MIFLLEFLQFQCVAPALQESPSAQILEGGTCTDVCGIPVDAVHFMTAILTLHFFVLKKTFF